MSETTRACDWFALQVLHRKEKSVAEQLRRYNYQEFLPLRLSTHAWSDRKKVVRTALFPGYLFCKLDAFQRSEVMAIPGVMRILGDSSGPVAVPVREIEQLKTLVASRFAYEPWPYTTVGQVARITSGALAGLTGPIVEVREKTCRLVISVELLNRSVALELDWNLVRPEGLVPAPLPRVP